MHSNRSDLFRRAVNRLVPSRGPWAILLVNPNEAAVLAQIRERFRFYLPGWRLEELPLSTCSWRESLTVRLGALRAVPVIYAGQNDMSAAPLKLRENPQYWLNARLNCREAWEWHDLVQQFSSKKPDVESARRRFLAFVESRGLRQFPRCYVFGTGPSLQRAVERSWNDGIRIVCNTIVRDRELWHHIRPHMVVAADAGYHYSFTRHAVAFRADLKARLGESETLFLYPAEFDAFVRREFPGLEDRLIPIPMGRTTSIMGAFAERCEFPKLHNILPRMLSIACSLSDEVHLWGFDGRAPQATGFWANAARQSYPEYMAELREAYPAFFEELVPDRDPTRYMRTAFGDELEQALTEAEAAGKRVVMMHPSWTETLMKRYGGAGDGGGQGSSHRGGAESAEGCGAGGAGRCEQKVTTGTKAI